MFKFRNILIYFRKADFVLIGTIFLLVCFGLATIYGIESANPNTTYSLFKKQIGFAVFGFIMMFVMAGINYKSFRPYHRHLYVASIGVLLLVLFFGQTVRGTRGWFQIFGFGIQPVEIAKFAIIVWLATFFSKQARNIDLLKNVIMSAVGVGVFVLFVLMQPDFGSALTMLGIWFLMMIVLGIKRKHLMVLLGLMMAVSIISWFFVFKPYQKDRILVFLDPARDPLGRGYNITQAAIAVGSGQLYGRGLGYGSQSQLKFLPESQTDFIFAVLAEEFGFIGILVIVFLWIVLFWRIARIMMQADSDFGAFLVLGIGLLLFIQIMVNAGMNIGLAPVTGISLPFISYGGSFLIMALTMSGVIQSVAIRK